MTTLLLSDIHTGISTVEQLAAYVGQLMYYQFNGAIKLTNNEGVTFDYPYSQHDVFEANDGKNYMRFEFLVPMKDDASTTARLSWMHADEIDKVTPLQFPEGYKDANLTS